jgi:hypothetical protein
VASRWRIRVGWATAPLALLAAVLVAVPSGRAGAATADPAGAATGRSGTERPLRSFTLAASGDILVHTPVRAAAARYGRLAGRTFDFRPMFAAVRPLISSADLAICHLETPIAPPGQPFTSYPRYGVPPEIAVAIADAGYDRCSTASNHSLDKGSAGVVTTLDALDAAGVGHSGTARSPDEAQPAVFTVGGIRVAHLSYSFSFNGLRLPAGEPWRANLIDPARILADAALARSRGAEYVIASLHWGNEGSQQVTAQQLSVGRAITVPGGVDLVLGHHAHVVQPIGAANNHWIVYGLGNILSNMGGSPAFGPRSQDGAVVTLRVAEQPDGTFFTTQPVVHPTWVDRGSFVIVPVREALADPALAPRLRAPLVASLRRAQQVAGPFLAQAIP